MQNRHIRVEPGPAGHVAEIGTLFPEPVSGSVGWWLQGRVLPGSPSSKATLFPTPWPQPVSPILRPREPAAGREYTRHLVTAEVLSGRHGFRVETVTIHTGPNGLEALRVQHTVRRNVLTRDQQLRAAYRSACVRVHVCARVCAWWFWNSQLHPTLEGTWHAAGLPLAQEGCAKRQHPMTLHDTSSFTPQRAARVCRIFPS